MRSQLVSARVQTPERMAMEMEDRMAKRAQPIRAHWKYSGCRLACVNVNVCVCGNDATTNFKNETRHDAQKRVWVAASSRAVWAHIRHEETYK